MTIHALLLRRETSVAGLATAAILSSACFGAAVGSFVGRWQILYAAVKMPVYLLGTLAISFATMHVFAAREFPARRTFAAAIETVALTAVVLGALAPIVWLVSLSLPVSPGLPTAREQQAYRLLILFLTASVATAGIAGVLRLHARLHSVRLTVAWVAIYQFVGAQMGWLLKPWVSHTGLDDRFLPLRENLKGNFYEALFQTVISLFL